MFGSFIIALFCILIVLDLILANKHRELKNRIEKLETENNQMKYSLKKNGLYEHQFIVGREDEGNV